ncbi:hypothetical protein NBO_46g0004 [Nosema bombycis CQ1]|uniref:Uncharacterized protein n=1 Tax=Nosema bombycis (strain CQ1 / CVCC 102059) TaxID=578461 RepID=R0M7K9_NOSB1|nr:hypothetical protein NBO_46g0004 [Nosema bombycis CQ1]|eukprot:EOB13969.1 hypothetical protein NBO_46g0004 [Nosema bombycis CQ1]
MLSKETRFTDLPHEIKQKLINIHKLSQQKYVRSTSNKIVNFNYLYSQTVDIQTNDLNENLLYLEKSFDALTSIFKNIKQCLNFEYVQEDLNLEIQKLKEEIEIFKAVGKDLDFCGELESTYKVLEKRFEDLKNKSK